MTVEELTSEDRSAAADLWAEVELVRPWNDPRADFDRALVGPSSTVLGIRAAGGLVGTAMVGFDGHRGWAYYVAVSPAHQGHGHGAALMAAAEDWLRTRGAPKIQVMVRHSNASVTAFYEGLGYEDAEVSVLSRWIEA